METHSSILAWKIPWMEGYSPQSHKDRTQLSTHTCMYTWGLQPQPLSPLLAGWCLMSVKPLKACWSRTRKSTSWCKGTEWVDFWSRQCPFRGSSTDLTTAPDGLCSLWLVRHWLSFSPGISARGWYFMWLQEIQLHQSSLTKGSILIQGVCGWYSRANVTIQRTWFFSFTSSDIFCPQSGKMATSASASCQNWRQKEQTQKEDRMALLLQKQSQPTGLVLPPLGHMLTPAMRNTVHLSISCGYIAVTRKIVVLLVMRRGQMLVSWCPAAHAIWAGVNLPYTSRSRETSFLTVWWIILTIPNQTFLQS